MQCALAAGVSMGAGSMLGACAGVRRLDLPQQPEALRANPALDESRREILYHAALAPSGHNSQPWRVRIESTDEWIVEADPERRLQAVDPDNRELMLSLGAFAENLSLAAGAVGYDAKIQVVAKEYFDRDVIRVSLRTDHPNPYPLGRITRRMTARPGYRSDEIRAADIEALRAAADGRLFYFPKSSPHADRIRDGVVECSRIQSLRDAAQRELVSWLRLSDRDALEHRDGLTAEGMDIQGFKGWIVRHFIEPENFMKTTFRQKGIDQTARLAAQGGGWLVITSSGRTVADLIEAGRLFERMALLTRERGIGLHPTTQILEEKHGIDLFASHHGSRVIPQFVIRVGYLDKYPEPVSLRRPVEWFAPYQQFTHMS
ncbi:MAG: nitroreductase [Desulfobacteraceae bacterium]|nr:MAG: nitroreductase [Desulfobacteraceae bacterium]